MIKFVSGDFFSYDADIMVNTVNCVGVMGAGVALAFKKRFPEMFSDYVQQCKRNLIRPGHPTVWVQKDMISKKVEIINFPTKNDWRKPSEYPYIEEGLEWLASFLEERAGKIVTLPALGCGHGGLEWEKVRAMILEKLEDSPADIYVFEPNDSKNAISYSEKPKDYKSLLAPLGIGVLRASNASYPSKLRKYTNKDLFHFPMNDSVFDYDFALVCSTKPSEAEARVIVSFSELCKEYEKSILLGSSAFEKKLSLELSKAGITCGCFLPCGIYSSVEKMVSKYNENGPFLLSVGDPFKQFDRKEFLPSVLSRIHLAKSTIFLSDRLAWLSKYKNVFSSGEIDSYYINWPRMTEENVSSVTQINAKKLDPSFVDNVFGNEALFGDDRQI